MAARRSADTSPPTAIETLPVSDSDENRFRALGRCVYPLAHIGWRYAGGMRWSPPSQPSTDDHSWHLNPDPIIDRPGMSWIRGSICVDVDEHPLAEANAGAHVETAGLCGAESVNEDGVCSIHFGLPYENMDEQAWDRVRAAVLVRQQAAIYSEQAWCAMKPSWLDFWFKDSPRRPTL